jgi:hypothetical protein
MAELVQCLFSVIDAQQKVKYHQVFAMKKGVDYLLIAKPVAFNQLGIRHDCAVSFMIWSVVGSSL